MATCDVTLRRWSAPRLPVPSSHVYGAHSPSARRRWRDAPSVAALINAAYHVDPSRAGWTTEADLLEGPRTDEAEIAGIIASDDAVMLRHDAHERVEDARVELLAFYERCGYRRTGSGSEFPSDALSVSKVEELTFEVLESTSERVTWPTAHA